MKSIGALAQVLGVFMLILFVPLTVDSSTLDSKPNSTPTTSPPRLPYGLPNQGVVGVRQRTIRQDVSGDEFWEGELTLGLRENPRSTALSELFSLEGITQVGEIPELGALLVSVPGGEEEFVIESLRRSGMFRYVELNGVVRLDPLPAASAGRLQPTDVRTQFIPNDPFYSYQWGLSMVRAPQAWDLSRGSSTILVTVIDSGYDVGHPDQPQYFYVGADYVVGGYVTYDGTGHGTHVVGIIGARTNNGAGLAGLAHNVSVAAIRVLDSSGSGSFYNIAAAIQSATNVGSRIINISIGGTTDASLLRDAVAYATSRGVLVVAASGNCGISGPSCPFNNPTTYPAAYSGVMAVGATHSGDNIASYSGHREYVSVSAPGSSILSTVPWYASNCTIRAWGRALA